MDSEQEDVLGQLESQCATCRMIFAKLRRRLLLEQDERQHLKEELYFMRWAQRILSGRNKSPKPRKPA